MGVSSSTERSAHVARAEGGIAACPACGATGAPVRHEHSVAAASEHLVPAARAPERNAQLREALRELFGGDRVLVRRCNDCGFWFADPFVSGTPEIYNLITEGSELYPAERFEFGLTIDALRTRSLDLLEIGAGDGAFLRKARAAGITGRLCATEYDDGSLGSLAAIDGVETFRGSPQELAAERPGSFDAICMFQVLEHMDHVDEVFAALRALMAPGGQLFIGVPNDASVSVQEELTGFWEMPPNHIGRWTRGALESVASRHGFTVLDHQYEPVNDLGALWEMAKCRCQARAYESRSIAGRVNAWSVRPVRGPAKRLLAGWDLMLLAPNYGRIPPRCQWFQLGEAT